LYFKILLLATTFRCRVVHVYVDLFVDNFLVSRGARSNNHLPGSAWHGKNSITPVCMSSNEGEQVVLSLRRGKVVESCVGEIPPRKRGQPPGGKQAGIQLKG
jgi:hypothetical protein